MIGEGGEGMEEGRGENCDYISKYPFISAGYRESTEEESDYSVRGAGLSTLQISVLPGYFCLAHATAISRISPPHFFK